MQLPREGVDLVSEFLLLLEKPDEQTVSGGEPVIRMRNLLDDTIVIIFNLSALVSHEFLQIHVALLKTGDLLFQGRVRSQGMQITLEGVDSLLLLNHPHGRLCIQTLVCLLRLHELGACFLEIV